MRGCPRRAGVFPATVGAGSPCVCSRTYGPAAVESSQRDAACRHGSHACRDETRTCSLIRVPTHGSSGRQRKVAWQVEFSSEILTIAGANVSPCFSKKKKKKPLEDGVVGSVTP